MAEPTGPVTQECVEAYLYAADPLRLLLFRRPPARGGIWVPVSGKVEPSDADWESAVRRELREETGLSEPRKVFPLDWHVRFSVEGGAVWRLHAYGVAVGSDFRPTLSPEHDEWSWTTPDQAVRRLHYDDNRRAVGRLLERLRSPSPNV